MKRKRQKACEDTACTHPVHGIFAFCKTHLKLGKMKWAPASAAIHTLKHLIRGIDKVLDLSNVQEAHINHGAYSNTPLICRTCNHTWEPVINNVINGGSGCPECAQQVPWTIKRLLERARTMQLPERFDFSRITAEHIDHGCNSKIPLLCRTCNHTWDPSINSVINGGNGCPECAQVVPWTVERLLERARTMQLTEKFDFSRITAEHINHGAYSNTPLICRTCNHTWEPVINNVINGGSGCPECAQVVPWTVERLLERARTMQLTERFDFSRITAEHIDHGAHSNIPLTCIKCNHKWSPVIDSVLNGGHGCPECAQNVPWTIDRLLERARTMQLTERFDFSRITAEHINHGKNSNIPLTCIKCNHKWSPVIDSVLNGGHGCPECAQNVPWTIDRLLERARTMQLTERFDFSRITAEHINHGNNSKIPLLCRTCNHEWEPVISSVINHGTGCPKCKMSKMELCANKVLEEIKTQPSIDGKWTLVSYTDQYRLRGTKFRDLSEEKQGSKLLDLKADFLLIVQQGKTVHKMVLELDGAQHFEPVYFGDGGDCPEFLCKRQKARDAYQDRLCMDRGYKVMRLSHSVPFGDYNDVLRYMISRCCSDTMFKICKGDEYQR